LFKCLPHKNIVGFSKLHLTFKPRVRRSEWVHKACVQLLPIGVKAQNAKCDKNISIFASFIYRKLLQCSLRLNVTKIGSRKKWKSGWWKKLFTFQCKYFVKKSKKVNCSLLDHSQPETFPIIFPPPPSVSVWNVLFFCSPSFPP
jgi:hypothetical protein